MRLEGIVEYVQLDHKAWTVRSGYEDEIEETKYAVRTLDGSVRRVRYRMTKSFAPRAVGPGEFLTSIGEPDISVEEYDALGQKTPLAPLST